ncbi:MAG: VWA domain-containing protein [Verrucomicrobiales bacterium]|jgi:Ca-activated chloride channel homolog|nr:VWA domain-containing protein [Verrucomicrobiales bacterium]
MDWFYPNALLLILPGLALLFWFDLKSTHPMPAGRRRFLFLVRSLLLILAVVAIASPAKLLTSRDQSVLFLLDHSRSQGEAGMSAVYDTARSVSDQVDGSATVGYLATGEEGRLLLNPGSGGFPNLEEAPALMDEIGASSNFERGFQLARGLFPGGSSRHLVLVGDGVETRGSLLEAAREAAIAGIKIHAIGVSGEIQPDVRVTRLTSSQSRLNEGASLELEAIIESSLSGPGRIRLFENGVEVEELSVDLVAGETLEQRFKRVPEKRNIYNYRVVIEGFEGRDSIPENNEALSIVDVRGRALYLYIEGEEGESRYLVDAMGREGIRLDVRTPEGLPESLQELAGYDGIILSDIPAHRIGEARMSAIRDYVEKLGGGFVMIGGMNSFGVGGYYRTPIEEVLPVKLKAPDQEESQSSALALVIDRSGSMSGQKIEICKAAAVASAELLSNKDFIGVYAFDSQVHEVVPMTKVTSTSTIAGQIALIGSGGGTNIYPGMAKAREELNAVKAKVKHMIVLSDGQSSGDGYQALASQCHAEGITISTVAVGSGAQVGLLQSVAAAGGGQSYVTMDPNSIVRIFTQDTLTHTGRMIREEAFEPRLVEAHPMLRDWEDGLAPPLLGYVKTNRKATAQVPLVTDTGDPLLAHWRFGLGKVTAFTSDCKSRWAALWVSDWPGYSALWSQILRETARPPQGLNMDLRLEESGSDVKVAVDLAEDAGTRRNGATVEAEVFYVPASALASGMKTVATLTLEQEGPGWYSSQFRPSDPGVYLVRARSGSQIVSAGYVHNPSEEVATGRVDEALLRQVCEITGGTYLESADQPLELTGTDVARYVELWPYLMMAFLAVFLLDLFIRRWENVMGVGDQVMRLFGRQV